MAGRHLISEAGRAYRIEIVALLFNTPHTPLTGPLKLTIRAHRPDNRRRDIDNILKPLLDALAHAGQRQLHAQRRRSALERQHDTPTPPP
jgi:crossover junction endodeoxyribonuclease RusA